MRPKEVIILNCFELQDFNFTYPGSRERVLKDINVVIPCGQFITVCGLSGCGKTTLLRQLKPALSPHGQRRGNIFFMGRSLFDLPQREQAEKIGFVLQNPDNQLVTDKVWHELAFGLESLGYDNRIIRSRVAEMAAFFGIEQWFYQNVSSLSGGQKQLLNLASVMAMQPDVLILDEPTAQLDPIAAGEFLTALGRINRELATTVILSEHRLEEAFPLSHRVLVLDQGKLISDNSPAATGEILRSHQHAMFAAMPAPMRIWAAVPNHLPCPVTVREGRDWLKDFSAFHELKQPESPEQTTHRNNTVLRLKDVWFRYEQGGNDVLKGLSLDINAGEFLAIMGGNGAGKSTALAVIAGALKPYRGKRETSARIALLTQDPRNLFVKKTVAEDLREIFDQDKGSRENMERRISHVCTLCGLHKLLERHPYDLSGGEQQRLALAKVLLTQPELLLLDEPTKGLDAEFKQVLAAVIKQLTRQGTAVLMVSHDTEFCAEYADRCGLFFDGNIVSSGTPHSFFAGNSFYTTAANRLSRGLLPEAITVSDVVTACGGQLPSAPVLPGDNNDAASPDSAAAVAPLPDAAAGKPRLPLWRRVTAVFAGCAVVAAMIYAFGTDSADSSIVPYLAVLAALLLLAFSLGGRRNPVYDMANPDHKLSLRTWISLAAVLLAVPATIWLGVTCWGDRRYYLVSLLILLETMLPFFISFEGRKPQARELVVIAVLCGIGVVGRAAFFMLPQFKPMTAIVIIAGVALGGESGFLVGAMTMLVSNILFSQGPWTPWQMMAMGLIGCLAGVLFPKGCLPGTRVSLTVFGGLAALLIYGGIMNPASAIMWQGDLNWQILLTYYISGLPFDLIHAAATMIFLWLLADPLLEKLERIKTKYGF